MWLYLLLYLFMHLWRYFYSWWFFLLLFKAQQGNIRDFIYYIQLPRYFSDIDNTDMRSFFVMLSLKKSSMVVFLIAICASASVAVANSIGLFSAQKMDPTSALSNDTSTGFNNDFFTDDFTKFTSKSPTPEYRDTSASPLSKYFQDITAISLQKDHDKIIWSLAPSLSTYSLNPIDDIKNVQVLFRYKF